MNDTFKSVDGYICSDAFLLLLQDFIDAIILLGLLFVKNSNTGGDLVGKKVVSTVVLLFFVITLLLAGCGEQQNFNVNHPELRRGEVFVTNTDADHYRFVGWETKRAGEVSYDIYGEPLDERWPNSFPVFAQRSEVEAAGLDIEAMKAGMGELP